MTLRLFDYELIAKAADFAREKHAGQKRKYTNEAYIVHPQRVAEIIQSKSYATTDMVVAAYLHDVVEDCNVSYAEILEKFGGAVANMVGALTKAKGISKKAYYATLKDFPVDVRRIKLADRLDNISDLDNPLVDSDFREYYIRDTQTLLKIIDAESADEELAGEITTRLKALRHV